MRGPDLWYPDRVVEMPDGRRVGVDDRGDPRGRPVLFLHGTPDTRVGRHPDDGIARELGIRLVAADRPGVGGSDLDHAATPMTVADDHTRVLDRLGIGPVSVLAWSAGAIAALALAGRHPARVERMTLVAPLVPADAFGSPEVLEGADETRQLFVEAALTTPAEELGSELAPWLVPAELDDLTARAVLAESLEATAHIDGAAEVLVTSLIGSVERGLAGLEREVVAQATPLGSVLDEVTATGSIHVGTDDRLTPPAMSRWLGRRLDLPVVVHSDEGHMLALTRWETLLAASVAGR